MGSWTALRVRTARDRQPRRHPAHLARHPTCSPPPQPAGYHADHARALPPPTPAVSFLAGTIRPARSPPPAARGRHRDRWVSRSARISVYSRRPFRIILVGRGLRPRTLASVAGLAQAARVARSRKPRGACPCRTAALFVRGAAVRIGPVCSGRLLDQLGSGWFTACSVGGRRSSVGAG
jgi:hypothetical protein